MDQRMIGKIEKAGRYAAEPNRVSIHQMAVTLAGDNNQHEVTFDNGTWKCDCECFMLRRVCSHSMALERMLDHMLPVQALQPA
jgi:hypothetical protein